MRKTQALVALLAIIVYATIPPVATLERCRALDALNGLNYYLFSLNSEAYYTTDEYFCASNAPAQYRCKCGFGSHCKFKSDPWGRDMGVCGCCPSWMIGILASYAVIIVLALLVLFYSYFCMGKWWCDGYPKPPNIIMPRRGPPITASRYSSIPPNMFRGYRSADFVNIVERRRHNTNNAASSADNNNNSSSSSSSSSSSNNDNGSNASTTTQDHAHTDAATPAAAAVSLSFEDQQQESHLENSLDGNASHSLSHSSTSESQEDADNVSTLTGSQRRLSRAPARNSPFRAIARRTATAAGGMRFQSESNALDDSGAVFASSQSEQRSIFGGECSGAEQFGKRDQKMKSLGRGGPSITQLVVRMSHGSKDSDDGDPLDLVYPEVNPVGGMPPPRLSKDPGVAQETKQRGNFNEDNDRGGTAAFPPEVND